MTNIGALKVTDKKENQTHIIVMADGMGSNQESQTKTDSHQKLFRIGDNLLTGTGRGDLIQMAARELRGRNPRTSGETAHILIDWISGLSLTPNDITRFIVSGKDHGGELAIYHVDFPAIFRGELPEGARGRQPLQSQEYAFDGSGSRFVGQYVQSMRRAGRSIAVEDLADGLCLMYDFGKKGAEDAGVNDKLQFGIIGPDGVSRLYHPDIRLEFSFPGPEQTSRDHWIENFRVFYEYLAEMTGIELPLLEPECPTAEWLVHSDKRHALKGVLDSAYTALSDDLARMSGWRHAAGQYADSFFSNGTTAEDLEGVKARLLAAKQGVTEGVHAMATRGLDALIAYRQNHTARQEKLAERAYEMLRSEIKREQ